MHCPTCHYEYEDWATVCDDCGTALVPGAPPPPAAPAEVIDYRLFRDWVVLTNVPNMILGNLVKDQLEHAGIPVLLKRSRATDIAEFSHNDYVAHDIYVPLRLARRARQLVDSPPTGSAARGGPADSAEDLFAPADDDDDAYDEGYEEAAAPVVSGWYLVDSARPGPLQPALPPPPAGRLPSLGAYQRAIGRRKSHRPPAVDAPRILPFPGRGAPPRRPDDDDLGADARPYSRLPGWTQSPIYRLLMGLLLLAWTLPFFLQMLQSFRDAVNRLFP
ncbi:MAG TPA: hypothetical protein VKY74_11420 [Chloroflexia bacterium]|nr:hypothetical protein [Chloroflexia bacterium]